MSARRPGGCPGPEVPGAQAEGRLSPTAVCHISAPRPRRAVLPRSSRGGHGGGRKAGPEPLCMNAPGSRAIGCVAFQPTAGTITSVASCPRGGDGVPRRAARSDGTPPMTARLASVMRRWVGWAARWRGRRGRDRRRWPRFRPDSRPRGVSMPAGSRRVPDGRWRTWPPLRSRRARRTRVRPAGRPTVPSRSVRVGSIGLGRLPGHLRQQHVPGLGRHTASCRTDPVQRLLRQPPGDQDRRPRPARR